MMTRFAESGRLIRSDVVDHRETALIFGRVAV